MKEYLLIKSFISRKLYILSKVINCSTEMSKQNRSTLLVTTYFDFCFKVYLFRSVILFSEFLHNFLQVL